MLNFKVNKNISGQENNDITYLYFNVPWEDPSNDVFGSFKREVNKIANEWGIQITTGIYAPEPLVRAINGVTRKGYNVIFVLN